jgi:hypothetical protein
MASKYIQRIFNLEPKDYRIIINTARDKGFGPKGHSAALRFILRDWKELNARFNNLPLILEGRLTLPEPESEEE